MPRPWKRLVQTQPCRYVTAAGIQNRKVAARGFQSLLKNSRDERGNRPGGGAHKKRAKALPHFDLLGKGGGQETSAHGTCCCIAA